MNVGIKLRISIRLASEHVDVKIIIANGAPAQTFVVLSATMGTSQEYPGFPDSLSLSAVLY